MTLKGILNRRAAALSLLATGLGVVAAPAASAQAAALPISLTQATCPAVSSQSQPFAAWGDTNSYWLVPGGNFSGSLAGWSLTGNAHVVSGGSPWALDGAGANTSALSLGAGSSATTPTVCVDASQPTFRFLDTGSSGSTVNVSVVYQNAAGLPVTAPVGVLNGNDWNPSPAYQDGASLAGALNGGTAKMAIRFTAVSGTTHIDDVFVDPRMGWH